LVVERSRGLLGAVISARYDNVIRMMYERQGKTEGGIGAGGNDQDHEHARTLLSRQPYPPLENLQTISQTPDQEPVYTCQPRDINRKKNDARP
jgi:hypothetical protein